MASMSDYLEGKLIDYCLRGATFTQPTTVYIALSTAATTDATTGSTLSEPSGNGYSRQALTCNTTNWTKVSSTDGTSKNGTAVTFTASGGSWGTLTHFAIVDASTAGNVLFHGPLTASKTLGDGDSLTFPMDSISIVWA